MILSYALIALCFILFWELVFMDRKKVRIHPIINPGFIKITTFDRVLCKTKVSIVHPDTKVVMGSRVEPLTNCIPVKL